MQPYEQDATMKTNDRPPLTEKGAIYHALLMRCLKTELAGKPKSHWSARDVALAVGCSPELVRKLLLRFEVEKCEIADGTEMYVIGVPEIRLLAEFWACNARPHRDRGRWLKAECGRQHEANFCGIRK